MNPIINDDSIDCSICFEPLEKEEDIKKLDCGHIFHEACINPWIAKNPTCPLCRKKVESLTYTDPEINSFTDPYRRIHEDSRLLWQRVFLVTAYLFTSLCGN